MNKYHFICLIAVLSIAAPAKADLIPPDADMLPPDALECVDRTAGARCDGGACVASRCSKLDFRHWDAGDDARGPPRIEYDCLLCAQGIDAGHPAKKDAGIDAGHPAKKDAGIDAGHPAKKDGGIDAGHPAKKDGGRDAGHPAKKDASSDAAGEGGHPTGIRAGGGCDCRLDPSRPMSSRSLALLLAALVPLLLRRRRNG